MVGTRFMFGDDTRTRARRVGGWALLVTLLAWPVAAQLSREAVTCRATLGKGVAKLADVTFKERQRCHKLRMQGLIAASVDCNDPLHSIVTPRVTAAAQKLASAAARCAPSPAPAELGYEVCASPCDTLPITTYASLAECFACLTEAHVDQALITTYDSPPLLSSAEVVGCQSAIGTALRKFAGARFKQQRRCQLSQDQKPTGADCRAPDTSAVVTALRDKIARCSGAAIDRLNSCAEDLGALQVCTEDAAVSMNDALFDAIYRPSPPSPTPTPTPSPVPSATPTLTATETATATVAPPSPTPTASPTATAAQPCNPDSETYNEPSFLRSLAYRWAPLIMQDTASKWNADFLGKINYDNDWRSDNNWDNLPSAGIAPYIYYDVLETATHWFIHYHTYHPRDWDNIFFGGCAPGSDCHENDTENILVMVQKDGSTFGRFRVLETLAHTSFYQYALANDGVSNGSGPDADDIDNDSDRGFSLFTDPAVGVSEPRPAIYIESKGHGICDWWDNDGPYCTHADDKVGSAGNDGIMYYPNEAATPAVPPNPSGGDWYNFKSPYNLISVWDDVWVLRSCLGEGKTFDDPFTYPGVAGNGGPFIGGALDGDDHSADAGTAWWAQGQGNLAPGEWTMDPARTVLRQLTFAEPVATTYLFNPYLGIQ